MTDDTNGLILRFVRRTNPPPSDIRTGTFVQVGGEKAVFYKHTSTGDTITSIQQTIFWRMNPETSLWEKAGEIQYMLNNPTFVVFGVIPVNVKDLRKLKKRSSKSRRFNIGDSEYKWKNPEGSNLLCIETGGRTVASWNEDEQKLWVAKKVFDDLDRITVTCFLNAWLKRRGVW